MRNGYNHHLMGYSPGRPIPMADVTTSEIEHLKKVAIDYLLTFVRSGSAIDIPQELVEYSELQAQLKTLSKQAREAAIRRAQNPESLDTAPENRDSLDTMPGMS